MSLITQVLYAIVFVCRYLNLYTIAPSSHYWNFVLKIFYILSSLYIIAIMLRVFPRSREREKAWKFGAACLGGSLVLAPFVMMIFTKKSLWSFFIVRHLHMYRAMWG